MTYGTTTYCERSVFFSLFFSSVPPPGLPPSSVALPAGIGALPGGSEGLPAGSEAFPAGSEALPAGSEAHQAGSKALPAGSEALPAGSKAHPAPSSPRPSQCCSFLLAGSEKNENFRGGTIGHCPLWGRCPLTTKLTE